MRKAVVPAAGYGTRLLPVTKSIPKEVLPLVDKPIIQIIVEELVDAGISDIIIVTSPRKSTLVEYFGDVETGLAAHLQKSGKTELLESLDAVKNLANFAFVEQHGVYGTGTPVLCAEPYLGDEPFIYTFADDFFLGDNCFQQLIAAFSAYDATIIGCQTRISPSDYDHYGYLGGEILADGAIDMEAIIEHPGEKNTPGPYASLGGFVVTPEVFPYLYQAREKLSDGQELYFNSALSLMLADGKQLIGKEIAGADYFDTGNKLEYMKTAVAMAARHPEIGDEFKQFLKEFSA